jgi:hypothetical protein
MDSPRSRDTPDEKSEFTNHDVEETSINSRPTQGSRVSVDHFDPEGVYDLQRTLSKMSQEEAKPSVNPVLSFRDSTSTIASEGPFDFAKALTVIMKK